MTEDIAAISAGWGIGLYRTTGLRLGKKTTSERSSWTQKSHNEGETRSEPPAMQRFCPGLTCHFIVTISTFRTRKTLFMPPGLDWGGWLKLKELQLEGSRTQPTPTHRLFLEGV
jgi:hypothetical protein